MLLKKTFYPSFARYLLSVCLVHSIKKRQNLPFNISFTHNKFTHAAYLSNILFFFLSTMLYKIIILCIHKLYTHDEFKIPRNCVTLQTYCLYYYIIIIIYSFTIHFRFIIIYQLAIYLDMLCYIELTMEWIHILCCDVIRCVLQLWSCWLFSIVYLGLSVCCNFDPVSFTSISKIWILMFMCYGIRWNIVVVANLTLIITKWFTTDKWSILPPSYMRANNV